MRFYLLAALTILLTGEEASAAKLSQVVPIVAGFTTVAVNGQSIWNGIKRAPKVVKSVPKGPKAIVKAAKGKQP